MRRDYLFIIPLVVYCFVRLWIATLNPYLVGIDGYFHLRIAEEILTTHNIVHFDNLSFGGRIHLYPPGFHLLIVSLSYLLPLSVEMICRLIGMIFGAMVVLLVYTTMRKEGKIGAALAASLLSLMPVFIWKTSINALTTSICLFLFFFVLAYRENTLLLLLSILLFANTHSSVFLLIPLLLLTTTRKSIYYDLLAIFLVALTFYSAIMPLYNIYGISIIKQNVPKELYNIVYEAPTTANLPIRLNILLFPLLIYAFSTRFFKWWVSFYFLSILLFTRILELDRAGAYIAVLLAILSTKGLQSLYENKTWFSRLYVTGLFFLGGSLMWIGNVLWRSQKQSLLNILLFDSLSTILSFTVLIIIFTPKKLWRNYIKHITTFFILAIFLSGSYYAHSWGPSIKWAFFTKQDRDGLFFLKTLPHNSTVFSTDVEGHWVTAFSKQNSFIDGHWMGIDDAQHRYKAMQTLYTIEGKNPPEFKSIIKQYNIDYILSSVWAVEKFQKNNLYEKTCLKEIYRDKVNRDRLFFGSISYTTSPWEYNIIVYDTEKCRV